MIFLRDSLCLSAISLFWIFPIVPCHAFCMWHWPIGKDLDLSFIWGHHHLHIVSLWISVDQLNTSQLATPCWRDPTRSKQLSTVAIWLSVWTLSCRCPVKLSKYQPCIIDLYHAAAILSPKRTKSFVFARPASHWMGGRTGKFFCFSIAW